MALTGTFIANFDSFYSAVQKAEVSLKSFEDNAVKVEKSLDRATNAFSGVKIVQEAQIAIKAVEGLGGVSTLTEQELRRFVATASEAAEKVDRLASSGVAITPEMLKIADASKAAEAELKKIAPAAQQIPAALDKVKPSVDTLIGSVTKMAGALGLAFSATAVIAGAKQLISHTIDVASAIDDASKKLGVSAEKFQGWSAAAQLAGATSEDVSTAVAKMNANLDGGSKSTVEALKAAGLEFHAIRNLSPEQAFEAIAEAVRKIPDPMTQAKVALELFGKGGQVLLPAIKDDIVKVGDAAEKMSNDTVKRLDAAGDAWEKFGNRVTIVTGETLSTAMSGWDALSRASFWKDLAAKGGDYALQQEAIRRGTIESTAAWDAMVKAQDRASSSEHQSAEELAAQEAALKKAKDAAEAHAKAVRDLSEAFTGEKLAEQIGLINEALNLMSREGKGLTDFQFKELGKQLDDFIAKGARLPPRLEEIHAAFVLMNSPFLPLIKNFSELSKLLPDSSAQFKATADSTLTLHKKFDEFEQLARKGNGTLIDLKGTLHLTGNEFDTLGNRAKSAGFQTTAGLKASADAAKNLYADMLASGRFSANELYKAWSDSYDKSRKANQTWFDEFQSDLQKLGDQFVKLGQISGGAFGDFAKQMGVTVGAMGLGYSSGEQLKKTLSGMHDGSIGAAQGMAQVGAAALSIVASLDAATASGSKFQQVISGALTGASAGAAFGPYGAAAGALAGALVGAFRTSGDAMKDFAAFTDQFAQRDQFGVLRTGADALRQQLFALGATGEKLWQQLYGAATHGNATLLLGTITEITTALRSQAAAQQGVAIAAQNAADAAAQAARDQQQDLADLTEAMQKYGFSVADMGDAFKRQNLDQQAGKLLNAFRLLVGAGADAGRVIRAMGGDLNKFVQDAVAMGQDLPIELQPILVKMAQMGQLFDANGNAITDLTASGITFGHTLAQQFDRVVDALNKILEALGYMPKKIFDASEKAIDFGKHWDDVAGSVDGATASVNELKRAIDSLPSIPGADTYGPPVAIFTPTPTLAAATGAVITPAMVKHFAAGNQTSPWIPQGTDTVPAMLTPGERVLSVADTKRYDAGGSYRGGGADVHIHIHAWDGKSVDEWLSRGGDMKLTRAVMPLLAHEAKRKQLTR